MSLKSLLHLDSIDLIKDYDPILKTYHCYNTNILNNKPILNIKLNIIKVIRNAIIF